jgi:uncharacterized membrane protein YeaQ/YmgE (transglycosylase-associated protein family)
MNPKYSDSPYLLTIPAGVIGVIFGIIVMRAFALNPMEELGLRIFMERVSGDILNSSTFAKFLVGGLFFGFVFTVASGVIISFIQHTLSQKFGSNISPPPLPSKQVAATPPPIPFSRNRDDDSHG